MKTRLLKRFLAFMLATTLIGMLPHVLRAQWVYYPVAFYGDGDDICHMSSSGPVTLAYDSTQSDNGAGSCYISTDYTESGVFQVDASVECCGCRSYVILPLSGFTTVEFDVKWDNSSTVPLSFFNTNYGSGTQGIVIGDGVSSNICNNAVFIPDAATNGWVHISAAINPALTDNFVELTFMKAFPAYSVSNTAAFWLDNLQLVGHPMLLPVLPGSYEGTNFTLSFVAIPGSTFSIFKSGDLLNWTNLVSGYPPGGATTYTNLSFVDTNATLGHAYYRVSWP